MIVAVLLVVALLLLAVVVDAGRLYIERARLKRAAQAAADAGIGVAAEHMVTLAVARQTQVAMSSTASPPLTATPTPPPQRNCGLAHRRRSATPDRPGHSIERGG